jgi:hypothetical protein
MRIVGWITVEVVGMDEFSFTRERIDQHVEQFGVTVRPAIEVHTERQRIQEFYNTASERYPDMFESLLQSPKEFQIKKTVPIAGSRGSLEFPTFVITPRGPVFVFTRALAGLDDEFVWPTDLNRRVIECLELLHGYLPTIKIIRIGKIRELMYDCGMLNSSKIIRDRFASNVRQEATDITIGWNESDDAYNRKFRISSVPAEAVVFQDVGPVPVPGGARPRGFAINVSLDVNNRSLDKTIPTSECEAILAHADEVFETRLQQVLLRDAR